MTQRYWWQEPVEDEGDVALVPPAAPPVAPPKPPAADPARLTRYREELRGRALLQPRASVKRREIEKRLCKVTADLLRAELKGRR